MNDIVDLFSFQIFMSSRSGYPVPAIGLHQSSSSNPVPVNSLNQLWFHVFGNLDLEFVLFPVSSTIIENEIVA